MIETIMVDFDRVDEQLVHALQVDGRASFSRIADVLGASDRTIARRYHRLRETGAVRVVAVPSSPRLGWVDWLVRIQCAPDTAVAVATTMARRDDTSWVYLTSGGVEVTCITHTKGQRAPLLLPRGPRITSVTAQCMLRAVAGTAGWAGRTAALTQEQVDRLRTPTPEYDVPLELTAQDQRLMAELAKDARAAYPALAAATGMPESTVRRRLGELLRAGAMYFDVEVEHVWMHMRFGEHYAKLSRGDLDQDRLQFYRLCMHLDLVAGPLRIAGTSHPEREWFRSLAEYHLQRALQFPA